LDSGCLRYDGSGEGVEATGWSLSDMSVSPFDARPGVTRLERKGISLSRRAVAADRNDRVDVLPRLLGITGEHHVLDCDHWALSPANLNAPARPVPLAAPVKIAALPSNLRTALPLAGILLVEYVPTRSVGLARERDGPTHRRDDNHLRR
jgi:hypothetical protein